MNKRKKVQRFRYYATSNSLIYHQPNCCIIQRIKPENLKGFGTLKGVNRLHPLPCKRCVQSSIEFKIRQLQNSIEETNRSNMVLIKERLVRLCNKKGYDNYESEDRFYVITTISKWYFSLNENPIRLYHQDYKDGDVMDKKQSFHYQRVSFNNAIDAIQYISKHDKNVARKIKRSEGKTNLFEQGK